MRKRTIAVILSFAMAVIGFTPLRAYAAGDETGNWQDSGNCDIAWYIQAGSGAASYTISDADDLAGLAVLVNNSTVYYDSDYKVVSSGDNSISGTDFSGKTIILTADIDLTGHEWTPIGWYNPENSNTYPFNGTFDGGQHKITGMSISTSTLNESGLFGVIWSSAEIKDFIVENMDVVSSLPNYADAGGIVGYSYGGTIDNCSVSGTVTVSGTWASAGGVVGYCETVAQDDPDPDLNGCAIKNSVSGCTVNGGDTAIVGGFVGTCISPVLNCWSTGNVTGGNATPDADDMGYASYTGGFAGYAQSYILNCFSTGNVFGGEGVIGHKALIGGFTGKNYGAVINCYATGNITGGALATLGGFTGGNAGTMTNTYWNISAVQTVNSLSQSLFNGENTTLPADTNGLTEDVMKGAAPAAEITYTDGSGSAATGTDAGAFLVALNGGRGALTSNLPTDETAVEWKADGGTSSVQVNKGYPFLFNVPTDKILVSITAPTAITGLPNGIAKTASAFGLPTTVILVTDNGNVSASVTWDIASCSYDVSSTHAQTFTVSGTVTLPEGVVNTNSVSLATSVNVTVNAASVTYAEISPVTGSFDSNPANQADVQTTVTWGDATGITDVKAGGSSIGAGNYNILGNVLTIKKEYLAAQATGSLTLTVEFNVGVAATLTISITDTSPPVISPAWHNYDLNSPADVTTAITWNSAASVTDVVYSVSPDTTLYTLDISDYTVSDDTLTIGSSFFSGLSLTTGAALEFDITFDTGAAATMTVNVVNNYTPSDDADLNSLSVNGTAVSGFDPNDTEYDVALPYGASSAIITATAIDSNAQVSITQASSLPGSATVMVTAEDGTTSRSYTINLTITAPLTTYTVTFSSNGSVYATKTANAGEAIGSANWPSNPVRSSYTFGGWFTGENGTGVQFTYDTPVNAATTVHPKWTYNGGGRYSSGGGTLMTPSTQEYKADVDAGNGSDTTLLITVDKNSGSAGVDVGTCSNLMSDGKSTVITVPTVPNVDTYTLDIPVSELSTTCVQGTLLFDTNIGSVTVPSNMLTVIEGISGSKAQISIGQGDKDNLPDDIKAAIGDRPLIQLTLSIDGTQTDWSNPNAAVTVSVPYTPTADELKNPESIIIWYIDGNVVTIPNGHYDPATGMVTFDITHFSDYAVSYNRVSFNDVTEDAWYSKAVSFITARGITGGTGNGNYSPDAKLTRGEFLVMLMKAYGIAPDTNSTDSFSDAGNTYYTGYLAAAKRLGITAGAGNNQYAPGKEITRQEMFTMLYNALKAVDQLPKGSSGKMLSDFADTDQIDSWAKGAMTLMVETGTIGGSNGALNPADTTTRAEMAQVLYNLLD
ncbi:MAG: X2-like carbohydrate binding domain-containing protein [Oscillospiraceae bacterium]|nr:X2-like carbohydrate binding domain-containing protein [Oscillospiraceae bacterium]